MNAGARAIEVFGRFDAIMTRMAELADIGDAKAGYPDGRPLDALKAVEGEDIQKKLSAWLAFVAAALHGWNPPNEIKPAAKETALLLADMIKAFRTNPQGYMMPQDKPPHVLKLTEWLEGEFKRIDAEIRRRIEQN